jgi:sec-independent protein translocase protein TatA
MDLFDSPWKVLIIAMVFVVVFGYKRLPDAARSLGKSMRILKTEVQDLHGEDAEADKAKAAAALTAQPVQPAPPSQQQIDHLQQQIRDLQAQPSTGQAATVNGAPAPEATQRTQQAG